jgi:hypothetical protein
MVCPTTAAGQGGSDFRRNFARTRTLFHAKSFVTAVNALVNTPGTDPF